MIGTASRWLPASCSAHRYYRYSQHLTCPYRKSLSLHHPSLVLPTAWFGSKAQKQKKKKVVEKQRGVGPSQAIQLIRSFANANFDETVEAAVELALDPRKPNQSLRKIISTPYSTGKKAKILLLTDAPTSQYSVEMEGKSEDISQAVDVIGGEEIVSRIEKDEMKIDFTHCLCTQDIFPLLRKRVARKLGPKQLMPTEKLGTVFTDLSDKNLYKKLESIRNGSVELRTDRAGAVRFGFGKLSLSNDDLIENFKALMIAIRENKPEGSKGKYLLDCHLSSTMGPGVKVNLKSCDANSNLFMVKADQSEVESQRESMQRQRDKRMKRRKTTLAAQTETAETETAETKATQTMATASSNETEQTEEPQSEKEQLTTTTPQ